MLELGLAVRDWVDGEDPYRLVAEGLGGRNHPPLAIAVTDSMPALHLLPLADVLGAVPVLATDVLRSCGCARTPRRSTRCARPARPSTACTPACRSGCVPGRTEAEVAADIAEAIVAEGHSEAAFIIVGLRARTAPTRTTSAPTG